jgi:hypothetical protein
MPKAGWLNKKQTMKKLLSILALTVVIATGCKTSKAENAKKLGGGDITFEYGAYTRGTKMDVKITNQQIIAYKGRPGDEVAAPIKGISAEQWSALLDVAEKVDPKTLEAVSVPSKKHQFDGALAANLKITVDGTAYQSPTFDHGNPPAEIKELVNKIVELSDLEKE